MTTSVTWSATSTPSSNLDLNTLLRSTKTKTNKMKLHTLLRQCIAALRDPRTSMVDALQAREVLEFLYPLRHEAELHTPIPS